MFKTRRVGLMGAVALLLVIALLAFAVACKDDKKDDDDETSDGGDTPAAEETADGEGDGDGGGDDVSADLEGLFGAWAESEGKITYEFTAAGGGSTNSGTFTLFWMPPSWRYDSVDDSGGQTTIISTGEEYYICSSESCLSAGALGEIPPPVPFFGLFTDPGALQTTFGDVLGADLETQDETIAGVDANCFSSEAGIAGASTGNEWCWSVEGDLLLRVRSVTSVAGNEFSYEFEATDVGEVAASDFEPPYAVEEFELPTIEIPTIEIPGQ